jgi:hypothetical protein
MKRLHASICLTLWAAAFASCDGCKERVPTQSSEGPVRGALEAVRHLPEPESLLLDDRRVALAGEIDDGNRYLAAVRVIARAGEQTVMMCSGAALSRHVVLTAGHCVCPLRHGTPDASQGPALIDGSSCVTSAEVEVTLYEPPSKVKGSMGASSTAASLGTVRPHPELKVMVDGEHHVKASHADLALIVLSEPLEAPGLPLSNVDVRMSDTILIVGHGYDEVSNVYGLERRSSMNTVTRLATPEDERVLILQPGGHRYRQDSGGPCLRQGAHGPELVGIASRWLGEGAAFTSTYAYRRWLRDEVRHAEEAAQSRLGKEPR